MSLLREYIREVLAEAAAGIADMKNKKVYYTASAGGIQVWLASSRAVDHAINQGDVARAGIVSTLNQIADGTVEAKSGMSSTYHCAGAYTITFSEVDQEKAAGFGPMLYDVVMELATEWDGGLTPDRTNVSDDAFNVWDYYHKNRNVEIRQLDDTEGRLTPDDGSDDCEQEAAYGGGDGRYGWWDEYDEYTPWDPDGKEVLLNSPLSKVYMSKGSPMVKSLEAAGKLVDIYGLEFSDRQLEEASLVAENTIAIGQCYPHAVKMAQQSTDEEWDDLSKFKVVHGKVTDSWKGQSYEHAWVEKGGLVFDWQTHQTKPNGIPKDIYYDTFQPEPYKEYTAEEAVINCTRSGQAGPWR